MTPNNPPKKPVFTGAATGTISGTGSIASGQTLTTNVYNGTYANPSANWNNASYTMSIGGVSNYTISKSGSSIISFHDDKGNKLVSLEDTGEVIWHQSNKITEAAEAFAKSIKLGAEIQAKITKSVKLNMRDSVFESLIEIAKTKGPLSADDLTILLEATKIVEKLKGGNDE